jgi:hypothetical protein
MTTLFFLIAIVFMMYEISVIRDANKRIQLTDELKNKKFWEESEKDLKVRGCLFVVMNMMYFAWAVIGFALASQWHMFVLLFSLSVIERMMLKIVSKEDRRLVKVTDAVLSAATLLWIFVNHFHPGVLPDLFPF